MITRFFRHILIVIPIVLLYIITLGIVRFKIVWTDGTTLILPSWI